MRTVVISDIHGNWEDLENILTITEVVQNSTKQPGSRVIFVGDIVDLGRSNTLTNDAKAATIAAEFGDDFLIGNHEFPFLFPSFGDAMHFGGMCTRLQAEMVLQNFSNAAMWQIATDANGWLITHAGLSPLWDIQGPADMVADLISDRFGDMLVSRKQDKVITGIEAIRGGADHIGGVVWLDARNLQNDTRTANPIPQIVGHTGIGPNPIKVNGNWFIDTGKGSVSAVVMDDGDDDWTPFTSRKG